MKRPQQKGFTLVEMLVVAPIVILAIGGFLTVIIGMTGEVLASRASNNLSYSVQDALNHIDQDVKLSSGFLATDSIPQALFGAAQGYDDTNNSSAHFTNVGGTSGTALILNMVATDNNPISASTSYIYLKNQPNACATPQSNTVGNKPFTYNIVYYVKNGNLYRRVLMPTNYTDTTNTVCAIPWQIPSCSPTYMDAQSGSVYCKTKDDELVDGVGNSGFNIQYYSGQSATTVNAPAGDSTVSISDRNTALQSATTVGVTIDAQQSAAGRTVERSAILRTSRLDNNASGVASITADGAPATPKIAASITEPTWATFTWARVPLATGYTIKYQINGGTWQTGFTDQNTLSYTVTSSGQNDVVNAQVVAINDNVTPSLSSATATASVTAPTWISPGLMNSWSNYNQSYAVAGYTKTADGLVVLRGLINRAGTFVNGEDLFILPPGYRPDKQETFQVESNNDGASVTVMTDGEVVATTNISASWVSLSDIKFLSTTSPHNSWTNLALQNSWVNRQNNADDPVLSYAKDAVGRYIIRGTIAGGTNNDGTIITTMPSDAATARYSHIAVRSGSGGNNLVGINTAQNIVSKGVAVGTAYFLNFMYLPDSYTGTWNTLVGANGTTLNSGWVNYNTATYNSAQYTKSSDGIVTLRGLIKSGTTTSGTVIATLPAGYRPSNRLIFATVCNGANCRIDVAADGSVAVSAGVSATWTSMDRISFMSEQ